MRVNLKYCNNCTRVIFDEFDCSEENVIECIKEKVADKGYPFDEAKVKRDNKDIKGDIVYITYLDLVIPNSAACLYYEKGFGFEIHTDEKIHINTPHIDVEKAYRICR